MEKDRHHSFEDPLFHHFVRQRRHWWRGAWWLAVVAAGLMLVPLLNAVLFAFYQSAYRLHIPPWLQVVGILSGRVFIPVAMAIVLLILHELSRYYRVPGELLVASRVVDVNHALQRILRRDAYLLFYPILTLPLIVICGCDGLVPPLVLFTHSFPWLNMAAAAVFLTGLCLAVCEGVILLRLRAYRERRILHILVPLALAVMILALGPAIDEAGLVISLLDLTIYRTPQPVAAIMTGLILTVGAAGLFLVNSRTRLAADQWREA